MTPSEQVRIIAEYICEQQDYSIAVADMTVAIMRRMAETYKDLTPAHWIDLTLRAVRLAHRCFEFETTPEVQIDWEVMHLASILHERLSDEAPSEQS